MRPRRTAVLAPLLLALVAGCGSTVATISTHPADLQSGDRSNGVSGPNPVASAKISGVSSAGSGAAAPASQVPSGAGASPSSSGDALTSRVAAAGGGVVDVRVGVIYLKGLDQAYKATGASSAAADSKGDYDAVIRAVNASASAGGRFRLRPSYYAVDASSTQSQASQVEAGCGYFTSDVKVDVVLTYSAGAQGALAHCLGAHGVPLIDGTSATEVTDAVLRANPLLWVPSQLTLDRLGSLEPSYLIQNSWISGRWRSPSSCATVREPRVGVVTFDRPDWRAVYANAVAPTFKQLGHPVYDAVFVNVSGSSAQQVAQASSQAQNAVLKFSSECIDHVAFVSNVAVDYLFMNVAAQQGYTPRYGLSSLEDPPVILANLPTSAASQLQGAIGPGWAPYSDVASSSFDAAASEPSARCASVLRRAGRAPTDNNSWFLALPSCDGPLFLSEVVSRWISGGAHGSLLSVVDGLGRSYAPSGTFVASFGSARHAGAAAYRGVAFETSCTCFKYVGGLRSLS